MGTVSFWVDKDVLKLHCGDFLAGPVVKTALPLQEGQVPSLLGELRSHMPLGEGQKNLKKQTNKQKPTRL